ncbi:3-methyl-2-oxobutanoate hydroxymethyltransferase [Methylobacterium trifolii]|uniref:3-methyl-2-oxobutanoate hydroxymethyltransferase n=1 Tax=Methylobacterium trifolii TaxID=1003092 RepID=UPI001EDDC8D2|nr:3-methyl-2-oxobutanoate hydroxymethyltransferase [Methylobacterium trifolii]
MAPDDLLALKRSGHKITMLSIHDYAIARIADASGLDTILVGDSLAVTALGHRNTVSVTLDEMLHHTRIVARGVDRVMVVADMPFLSYQVCPEEAVRNAGRFIKEAGADAVKIEGGEASVSTLKAIHAAGIPIMGHVGLTLQSAGQLGGRGVQGMSAEAARALIADALALEAAGAFAVILQSMPGELAQVITDRLHIPTISYGAGSGCDGQGLVAADVLGLGVTPTPGYARRYLDLDRMIGEAVAAYCQDVRNGAFPADDHTPRLEGAAHAELVAALRDDQ